MYILGLVLALALAVTVSVIIVYFKRKPTRESITCFSLNEYLPELDLSAKSFIENITSQRTVIVIHDDIDFFSPTFTWPKKCLYIHCSDMAYFSVRYLTLTKSNTEEQQAIYSELHGFLKSKAAVS